MFNSTRSENKHDFYPISIMLKLLVMIVNIRKV